MSDARTILDPFLIAVVPNHHVTGLSRYQFTAGTIARRVDGRAAGSAIGAMVCCVLFPSFRLPTPEDAAFSEPEMRPAACTSPNRRRDRGPTLGVDAQPPALFGFGEQGKFDRVAAAAWTGHADAPGFAIVLRDDDRSNGEPVRKDVSIEPLGFPMRVAAVRRFPPQLAKPRAERGPPAPASHGNGPRAGMFRSGSWPPRPSSLTEPASK